MRRILVLGLALLALVAGTILVVRHWRSTDEAGDSEGHRGMESMPGMEGMEPGGEDVGVRVPGSVQQRIGVTVGTVERGALRMTIDAVGIVRADETREARIHLRTQGWVEDLHVDYTGQLVERGEPLLSIYSPEFLSTQHEYVTARRVGADRADLAEAARRRLELWGVPAEEIERLEASGRPRPHLELRSPISGVVLHKDVLQGDYVTPEKRLYHLADLSVVWVQAKVYEYELPHVEPGQWPRSRSPPCRVGPSRARSCSSSPSSTSRPGPGRCRGGARTRKARSGPACSPTSRSSTTWERD